MSHARYVQLVKPGRVLLRSNGTKPPPYYQNSAWGSKNFKVHLRRERNRKLLLCPKCLAAAKRATKNMALADRAMRAEDDAAVADMTMEIDGSGGGGSADANAAARGGEIEIDLEAGAADVYGVLFEIDGSVSRRTSSIEIGVDEPEDDVAGTITFSLRISSSSPRSSPTTPSSSSPRPTSATLTLASGDAAEKRSASS